MLDRIGSGELKVSGLPGHVYQRIADSCGLESCDVVLGSTFTTKKQGLAR
jgi:hypothetical protein